MGITDVGTDEHLTPVEVNRRAIVFAITAATLVGLAPVAFAVGRPGCLVWFSLVAALTSTLTLHNYKTRATENPGPSEFLVAALGTVFPMALTGLLWLGFHSVAYQIAHWLHASHPGSVSFWVTVWPALVFTGVYSFGAETANYLYPDSAGLKSAYYSMLTERRATLITGLLALLVVLLILSIFIARGGGQPFYVLLETVLLFAGLAFVPAKKSPARRYVELDAIEKVAKVFEAAGYLVERFPRTQKSAADPLLSPLDLLAWKGENRLAITIKTGGHSAEPVDWRTASSLRTAAWVLSDAEKISQQSLKIMLVLVDRQLDKSLKIALRREPFLLVNLTSEELSQLFREGTDKRLLQDTVLKWLTPAHAFDSQGSRSNRIQARKRVPYA